MGTSQRTRPASPADVVRVASESYLRGRAIDMSTLAQDVRLSRATLYRRVGNHERLLATVVAEQTVLAWERVVARRAGDGRAGLDGLVDTLAEFIEDVTTSRPLLAFIERDPSLFIAMVMGPGTVERAATRVVGDAIVAALPGPLLLDPYDLAQACVRVCDSFMYTHLLHGTHPEIDTGLRVVRMLLTAASPGGSNGAGAAR